MSDAAQGPADLEETINRAGADSPEPMQIDPDHRASGQVDLPGPRVGRRRDPGEDPDGIGVVEFVRAVEDLGLIGGTDALTFLARTATALPSWDGRQLGRELVAAGWLTPYQAGAICQGKARGLVIGRYLVLQKLGAGGMGMVFKAQHRRLRQAVALKILPPSLTRNPELVQRFHREAQAAARLNHRNIVRAIDADEAGGVHFLVMEFVEGIDLSRLVKTRRVRSPARAIDMIAQAAEGLAVAHDAGIVHRDIKPSNLMLETSGVVKILDLGLARLDGEHSNDGGAITLSGAMMGTADYMSPEQAFDPRLADARSDIYSLGCTLHYLLVGTPPYGGASLMQRLLAHRDQPVPSLRLRRPDVPNELDALFEEMMAKDPKDRPGSMADLAERLESCKAAAVSSRTRHPRVLMVFDDGRHVAPPSAPTETTADAPESHVDPTPLPPLVAADPGNPRSGSGIRLEDKARCIYMILDADLLGFRSWAESVRTRDAMPAGISVFEGEQRPGFAAIALPNRKQAAWDLTIHSERYQFDIYSNTMTSRGFAPALFDAYRIGPRSGIVSLFRKTDDVIDRELDIDLPAVHARLEKIEKSAYRLTHLAGYPTPEGRRFAALSTRTSLRPQRYAYELTPEALETFATRAVLDGYVPISLTASPVGVTSRFAIILEKGADRGPEMTFDLTPEALATEFDRRTRRGFSPTVLCGFADVNSIRYHVGWIRGRPPKGL